MNPLTISPPDQKPASEKDHPAQFVPFFAHEIRNPLTNINLSVELLKSMTGDNDVRKYLDMITRSSMRISELVSELLKYQVINTVLAEEHSVCEMLDEVLEMAKDRIRLKNIALTKEYAEQDCKWLMDKQQMKIALTNIIINAIDAMTSQKGELKLVTKSGKKSYVVQIEDNGRGISKANIEQIFKPYFTNKPGGLGLGLATTSAILHSNKVSVKVESDEGKGTRFILSFKKREGVLAASNGSIHKI